MSVVRRKAEIALLTGGWDRPYAFGLTNALVQAGLSVDLIAGDDLTAADFPAAAGLRVFTLRQTHSPDTGVLQKALGVLSYYLRLVRYALNGSPKILHILWNNGYDIFDRTVLMLYYWILGKTIVLTAHNINGGRRDGTDTALNRLTLKFQYRLCDHIFVHTEQMKVELIDSFGVTADVVTVIPFGINNSVPDTALTAIEAKQLLGIGCTERTLLFFGNIAPYKGLEYLIEAFQMVSSEGEVYRLIVAGRRKPGFADYWDAISGTIRHDHRTLLKIEFIPDAETEVYFKAADVLVLPYTTVFQSGVLFLGYSFGLPALVADAGSLKEEIVEGENGFVFTARDSADLARAIKRYFASDLFRTLDARRSTIKDRAAGAHSWDTVARLTRRGYASALPVASLESSRT